MINLPAPLTPPDCDCTDLDGFMLNVERLMASELVALSSHEVVAAALFVWCRAWKQRPAASLPDDDRVIAAFSRLPAAKFKRLKPEIMRGFVKCADGRLYHRTLAAEAIKAFDKKLAFQKKRVGDRERLNRWRETRSETPNETPKETHVETRFIAEGQGQVRDRDSTGTKKEDTSASASRTPPVDASPEFIRIPTNRFESVGETVSFSDKFVEEFQALYPAVDVRAEMRAACAWCMSNPSLRKTKKGMSRFINAWLSRQQNKGVPRETGYRNGHQRKQSSHDRFNEGVGLFLDSLGSDADGSGEGAPGDHADRPVIPLLAP